MYIIERVDGTEVDLHDTESGYQHLVLLGRGALFGEEGGGRRRRGGY